MATICPACGSSVPDGETSCPVCMASIPVQTPSPAPKKQSPLPFSLSPKLLILIAAGGVVVVLLLVLIISLIASSGGDHYLKAKNETIVREDDGVVIIETLKDKVEIEGKLKGYRESLDGSSGVVAIGEETTIDDLYRSASFELYDFTGKLIAEDVHDYVLSANGKGVLMLTNNDQGKPTELRYYYGGKITTLVEDEYLAPAPALSPDGKSVAYALVEYVDETTFDYIEKEREAFLYKGGKTSELGKDVTVYGLSNGAKLVYYIKDDAFFVQKGTNRENRVKLGEIEDDRIFFNADHTECLFMSQDDDIYITADGKDKVKLKGDTDSFDPLTPAAAWCYSTTDYTMTLGVSTFEKIFYERGDAIYYIGKNFEAHRVVREVREAFLSADEKTLYYRKDQSIYSINGTNQNAEAKELIEDEAADLIGATKGGFYYESIDEEIVFSNNKGKTKIVSDEYDEYSSVFDGKYIFYSIDDMIYVSTGARGKALKSLEIDSVSDFYVSKKYILLYAKVGNDYEIYLSGDAKTFELYDTIEGDVEADSYN